MTRGIVIACVTSACLLTALCRCSPDNLAGAGSEAEGRTVAGVVHAGNGTPAVDALVRVRPQTHEVFSPSTQGSIADAYTDSRGTFAIDSVDTGEYLLEILADDSSAVAVRCTVRVEDDTVDVGDLSLSEMATLTGTAYLLGSADSVRVAVLGLERATHIGGTGDFSLRVPAGDFTVTLSATGSPNALDEWVPATAVSGAETQVRAAPFLGSCTDGACDTLAVRTICLAVDVDTSLWASLVGVDQASGRIVRLDLSSQGISVLPGAVGMLTELDSIDISNNQISIIPQSIGSCTKLRFADFGVNSITALPPQFGNLASLVFFTGSSNTLRSLPEEIGNLPSIQHFSLNENYLTTLPSSIGGLTTLEALYVTDNLIQSLPDGIALLGNVSTLAIRNNRLCSVSPEVETWLSQRDGSWDSFQDCQ